MLYSVRKSDGDPDVLVLFLETLGYVSLWGSYQNNRPHESLLW